MPNSSVMSSVRREFLAAVAEGVGPYEVAEHLGVPLDTVRLWLSRLGELTTGLNVACGPDFGGSKAVAFVPGLTVIHTPDVFDACADQVVTFTADVMNDGETPLRGITLVHYFRLGKSRNKARANSGNFESLPCSPHLLGTLEAGDMCSQRFSYCITSQDVRRGADLVSGVAVRATTGEGQEVSEECEARVRLYS